MENWLQKRKDATVDVAATFGRNLARCRKQAQMSQEEVGLRASLHRTAVGQIERGERTARIDTLVKLAGALDASPLELLDGIHWTPGTRTSGRFDSGREDQN
jgi:transcriptional regulator with XRE-family HTH domain